MDILIYSVAMRTSRMLTARIYTMLLLLSGGVDIFRTNNQEVLEVRAIGGNVATVYSYPAPLKISYTYTIRHFMHIYREEKKACHRFIYTLSFFLFELCYVVSFFFVFTISAAVASSGSALFITPKGYSGSSVSNICFIDAMQVG